MPSTPQKRSRSHSLLLIAALLASLSGCGYGEVSQVSYEYVSALYSICNRQDAARLEAFSAQFKKACEAGEVADNEAEWINDIVALAESGDWNQATANARQMMMDQVEGGP